MEISGRFFKHICEPKKWNSGLEKCGKRLRNFFQKGNKSDKRGAGHPLHIAKTFIPKMDLTKGKVE